MPGHPLEGLSVLDISRLDGVKDIEPIAARGKFAIALSLEAKGEKEKAESKLAEAIELLS